jgi:TfoX/Sxy family transcriptional regulator of competence genes
MADRTKPIWEHSSPRLETAFAELIPKVAGVTQKQMFGWPCCFVNGNLFAGLHRQAMIFRLADHDQAEFLKLRGAVNFEPMPGRKMKGYVSLAEPLQLDKRELSEWMGRALEHARTLPSKAKPARGKTREKESNSRTKVKARQKGGN